MRHDGILHTTIFLGLPLGGTFTPKRPGRRSRGTAQYSHYLAKSELGRARKSEFLVGSFPDFRRQFESENRCVMNPGHTFNRGSTITFERETKHQFGLIDRRVHSIRRFATGILEHLAALRTLIMLTVLAFTKLAACGSAVVATHCKSPR